jgi:hypothetical protein
MREGAEDLEDIGRRRCSDSSLPQREHTLVVVPVVAVYTLSM